MAENPSKLGIIAIGRNEGERLRQCLASVMGAGAAVVYVDSNSSDGSAELARSMGAQVVNLDLSIPFSAARARNEGFERLTSLAPDAAFVQFVDGDCEIVEGWVEAAVTTLQQRTDAAVVCGRRRERFPEKSIYNRIANMEWNGPAGEVNSCGGDALMRVAAFRQVGGFDPTVVAGEEPELCQRLREASWKILRIAAEMTLHDSAMLRFGQWWRRTVRSGYGAMDVATRFGHRGLFVRHVRSARIWALILPAIAAVFAILTAVGAVVGLIRGRALSIGVAIIVVLLLIYPMQILRTAWRNRARAGSIADAIAYGFLTVLGKFANLAGQMQYRSDRRAGKLARNIDYKQSTLPASVVSSQSA